MVDVYCFLVVNVYILVINVYINVESMIYIFFFYNMWKSLIKLILLFFWEEILVINLF